MKRPLEHTAAPIHDELTEARGGGWLLAAGVVGTFAATYVASAVVTYRRTEPDWNYCPRPDRAR